MNGDYSSRSMELNCKKLLVKLADFIAECEQLYDIKIVYGNTIKMKHVKKLRKKLYALKESENVVFVHCIGKRKTPHFLAKITKNRLDFSGKGGIKFNK